MASPENFFLFGLTAEEVYAKKSAGYDPMDFYQNNQELRSVINRIAKGDFSYGDEKLFKPIVDSLLYHDPYMLLADYQDYVDCQDRVSEAYKDQDKWTKMSILNSARMGKFSSDRTINEYCSEIWGVAPVEVKITD